MQKIQIIAVDLDGTLLKNDCTISVRNVKAIERALSVGIQVVPTTGRSYENSKKIVKDIRGIEYFINSNGTTVCNKSDNENLIHMGTISNTIVAKVLMECIEVEAFFEVYSGKNTYIEDGNDVKLFQYHSNHFFCKQLLSTIIVKKNLISEICKDDYEVNKLHIICKDHATMQKLYKKVIILTEITITVISDTTIEIVKRGESKANGIKVLCKYLNCKITEAVGIGDSMNDLEMLQAVGHPVAMGNAISEIKKVASFVTDTNLNDGVAEVIEKIIRYGYFY